MKSLFFLISFAVVFNTYSQEFSGIVICKKTSQPIEYVNIGILNNELGTVSDEAGLFSLKFNDDLKNETVLFSCIGYNDFSIKVKDLLKKTDKKIFLEEKTYSLNEVVVKPIDYKRKILGVKTDSKIAQAGFEDNNLGYECGVLINAKKRVVVNKLFLNIATCTYDSIFYRINFYKVDDDEFINILKSPIYINFQKEEIGDKISLDLTDRNIVLEGDFLITLEHVKDLGYGQLNFCAKVGSKTWYRKTSQGEWDSAPIGISISIDALVEK